MSEQNKRVSLDPQGSAHKGIYGLYESVLRRFKSAVHIATLVPLYGLAASCLGLALFPGISLLSWIWQRTEHDATVWRSLTMSLGVGASYFLFGFSLLVIVPLMNWVLRANPLAWRGPYYSLGAVKWYIHNGLTYLVRYTFLEFITPTPFNIKFYEWMGMKIGRGTQINSANISDPALITMGEKVTIGGSATIVAHYGQGGYLVIDPVTIGNSVTVGLKATIMGGVHIGEGAKVLPNSVVLPKTVIPAGETWGGVPAQKVDVSALKRAAKKKTAA